MKLDNIWKAWISTLLGLLIPVITGIVTMVSSGNGVDWKAVKMSLIATGLLALTDLFKEIQTKLNEKKD